MSIEAVCLRAEFWHRIYMGWRWVAHYAIAREMGAWNRAVLARQR